MYISFQYSLFEFVQSIINIIYRVLDGMYIQTFKSNVKIIYVETSCYTFEHTYVHLVKKCFTHTYVRTLVHLCKCTGRLQNGNNFFFRQYNLTVKTVVFDKAGSKNAFVLRAMPINSFAFL